MNVLTCFDHVFRDASGAIHGSTGHCCLAISDLKQPAFEVKQKAQAAEQQNGEVFFGVFLFWPSVSRRPIHSGARQTRSSASHSKDHQNPRGAGPAGPAWRRWTVTCDLPRWNMNLVCTLPGLTSNLNQTSGFLMIFGWFLDVNGCESSEILAGFSWNYYYGYYGVSKLDDAGLWHIGVPMCGIARSLFVWSRHSLPDCGQLEHFAFANADDVEEIHAAASKIKWHSTPLSKIMLQVISYVWIWKPMVIRATPCVTNAPCRAAGTRGSNHHLHKHCGGVPFLRNGALVACREKEKLLKENPEWFN